MKPNPTRGAVDFDELYPGRFLKAGQLKGQRVTLTIAEVHVEELEGDTGKKWKGIVAFHGTDMQWVLNRTNGECLKAMFGREVPKWRGRKVTIFPGEWRGEPAIRVWGSPELEQDRTITIQLPKKKPVTMVLHAVRRDDAKAPPTASGQLETSDEPTGDEPF